MRWIALGAALWVLVACQADAPPTSMPTNLPPTPLPTADANASIWLEQPFGGGTLAVYFYSADDAPCVRFLADLPQAQPISACAESGAAAVVAQGAVQGADGQPYTIIAVRALRSEVSVVAIELDNGESYPLEIEESGALLILPEIVQAWRAIPIDSYGDMVGGLIQLRP